jgi:hypothetical protein
MSEEIGGRMGQEIPQDNVNIHSVMVAYFVEMNESRADLFSSLKLGKQDVPRFFEAFLKAFKKFFDFTSGILDTKDKGLKDDINDWFNKVKVNDVKGKENGIKLSRDYQQLLDTKNIFPLFEVPITPPYISETGSKK